MKVYILYMKEEYVTISMYFEFKRGRNDENKKFIKSVVLSGIMAINMCSCSIFINETTTSEVMDDTKEVSQNIVIGNRFVALDDESEIQMDENGSFIFYRKKEVYDGDYCTGTYEAYYGQEAINKVVSLEQYGITEEEIEHSINATIEKGYSFGDVSGQHSLAYILESYTGEKITKMETYDVSRDKFYCIILHNDIFLYRW